MKTLSKQDKLAIIIGEKDKIPIIYLAKHFGVSCSTIRKNINELKTNNMRKIVFDYFDVYSDYYNFFHFVSYRAAHVGKDEEYNKVIKEIKEKQKEPLLEIKRFFDINEGEIDSIEKTILKVGDKYWKENL